MTYKGGHKKETFKRTMLIQPLQLILQNGRIKIGANCLSVRSIDK